MASQGPQPDAGLSRAPVSRGCWDPGGGSGPVQTPVVAEGPSSGLPRNVLSERERRFDGRREDMASVLEMAVQFLRMAGAVVPGGEPQTCQVLGPCAELWHVWQKDVMQALASPTSATAPEPGTAAAMTTSVRPARLGTPGTAGADASETSVFAPSRQRDPASCVTTDVGQGEASREGVEVLDRPAALPGPSSLAPWIPSPSSSKVSRPPPAWPPCSWQPTPPLVQEEAQSCSGPAGPLAEEANQAVMLGTRSVLGCDVEDGPSFLLRASPEWWLGSLEGNGGGAPAQAPARSSLLDRTELGFLADPGSSSQELLDGPLEPWGWDMGCPSLAFRDEADSMFPDFSAC